MDLEEVVRKVESTGINLQLQVSEMFREKGWDIELDKLYTDDEALQTREIDIVAQKRFVFPMDEINKNYFLKNKNLISIFGSSLGKITVDVKCVIECKYVKEENKDWVFVVSQKNGEDVAGLEKIIQTYNYPIFDSSLPSISFATAFKLRELPSFRKVSNLEVAETGQALTGDKTEIRSAILGVIKYLVFALRNVDENNKSYLGIGGKNNLGKIFIFLPDFLKKKYIKYLEQFPFFNLKILYPIVVVNRPVYSFSKKDGQNKVIQIGHILFNQSYVPQSFLNKKKIKDLSIVSLVSERDTVNFQIDILAKEAVKKFIEDLEKEVSTLSEAAKDLTCDYADYLLRFNVERRLIGQEKAYANLIRILTKHYLKK